MGQAVGSAGCHRAADAVVERERPEHVHVERKGMLRVCVAVAIVERREVAVEVFQFVQVHVAQAFLPLRAAAVGLVEPPRGNVGRHEQGRSGKPWPSAPHGEGHHAAHGGHERGQFSAEEDTAAPLQPPDVGLYRVGFCGILLPQVVFCHCPVKVCFVCKITAFARFSQPSYG